MPGIGVITINDGQATPVPHSFSPSKNQDGVIQWEDRATGVLIAYPKFAFRQNRNKQNDMGLYSFRFDLPVVETPVGGIPQLVKVIGAELRVFMPDRAPLALRKDLVAYVKNYFNVSHFGTIMETGETYY